MQGISYFMLKKNGNVIQVLLSPVSRADCLQKLIQVAEDTSFGLSRQILSSRINESVTAKLGFVFQLIGQSLAFLLVGESFLLPTLSVAIQVLDRSARALPAVLILPPEDTGHRDGFPRCSLFQVATGRLLNQPDKPRIGSPRSVIGTGRSPS